MLILIAASVGIMVFAVPVALVVILAADAGGGIEGEIRSVGQPHGDWVMRPNTCRSGEHENYFGVWIAETSGSGGGVRLVRTHVGEWEVYVASPGECRGSDCALRPLDRTYCRTFSVDVWNTNSRVNRIVVRQGHADLDCELPEGGSLSARVTFGGCS